MAALIVDDATSFGETLLLPKWTALALKQTNGPLQFSTVPSRIVRLAIFTSLDNHSRTLRLPNASIAVDYSRFARDLSSTPLLLTSFVIFWPFSQHLPCSTSLFVRPLICSCANASRSTCSYAIASTPIRSPN